MSKEETPEEFLRLWTTDAHGSSVLVGLTPEETAEYVEYRDRVEKENASGVHGDRRGRDRWLELHDKHEKARFQVIAAEAELRENPTRN